MLSENTENPVKAKIKARSILKKSSISKTTLLRLQTSIQQTLTHCPCRNSALAEEVLRSIEVNSQLTDYLGTLEEEIHQITQELAQLERSYRFAESMAQQQQYESFEVASPQHREHQTNLLLSRLNQVLSVSRSYGSKELLGISPSSFEEDQLISLRPPPLTFIHDS